jgi:type VI secretion system protein ImpB
MDGKDGAQDLLDKVLKDPSLMQAISSAKQNGDQPAADKPAAE